MTEPGEEKPEPDLADLTRGLDDLPHMPEPDDELDARLKRLEAKAADVRTRRDAAQKEQAREQKANQESSKGLGVGLMVAYTLLGLPMAGAAIGFFLDRGRADRFWTALFVLLGAVGGIVFTIVMLNRHSKE